MSEPIRVSVAVGVNGRMANWILPEDCFKKQFAEIRGAADPAAACNAQVQQMKRSLERVGLKKFVWELAYLHALYQMQEELAQEKGAENGNR